MALPVIKQGQRAVIAGRTGSGKSTLGRWLLNRSEGHWVILNPKWTKAYDKLPDVVRIKGFDLSKFERAIFNKKFIVIDPKQSEATPEVMDAFIQYLHDNYTGIGLVADELYTLHKNGKAGDGLISWLTRGRELKQSLLGLTQRPAWVSQFIFSESSFIGEMSLNLMADRKRMYEHIGNEMALEKLPPHKWLWYEAETDHLRYFDKVPL